MQTRTILTALCLAGCALAARPAAAEETKKKKPRLEIEALMTGGLRIYSHGGAFGGPLGGAQLGLRLGDSTVLMSGFTVGGNGSRSDSDYNWESYSVRIPLELKVYLSDVRPGRVVPLLRLGGAYSYGKLTQDDSSSVVHGLSASGSAGIQYLVSEQLGVAVDAGLTYGRGVAFSSSNYYQQGESRSWDLSFSWRTSLVFRF